MLLLPVGAARCRRRCYSCCLAPAATMIHSQPRFAAAVPLLQTAGCLLAAVDFVNNTAVLCVYVYVCMHPCERVTLWQ